MPYRPPAATRPGRADRRLPRTRRLRRRLAAGGRPEERPRVDGDGRSARHDPRRPGTGPRRRRRERQPRRRRRPRRRSRPACSGSSATRARRERFRAAGRVTAEENSHASARPAVAGAARGLRGAARWIARASRATAVPRPAGRGSSPAAAREPGLRVFYGWDAIPAPGEPVAGGTAKLQKLAARWPNRPTDFSLLYLGTTYLPRDVRPLLWLARTAPGADRRQPGRRRLSGLGGRPHGRAERAAPPRGARGRPRRLPERVQQALLRRRSSASPAAHGRSSRTRSTSSASRRARAPGRGPVLLLGGDQTQAYRLELGLETFRHVLDAHPDARLLVAGRLVSDPEPTLERLGLGGAVEFLGRYAQTRRARARSAGRTSCSTRRSTTRARRP